MIGGAASARCPGRGGGVARDVRGASRRFDEALRAARDPRRGADGKLAQARAPAHGPAVRRPPASGAPSVDGGRSAAGEGAGLAQAAGGAVERGATGEPMQGGAALRAAVRSLPPIVEAARLGERAEVTISLGDALGVELRRGAHGIELALRPAAALAAAAAAELPGLVAALRARGLRVARAEVRTGHAARRAGCREDERPR